MTRNTKILGVFVEEWDSVIISGVASSPSGHKFERLKGTVASIVDDGYIKVWPDEGEDDPSGRGKIWFPFDAITELEIIEETEPSETLKEE